MKMRYRLSRLDLVAVAVLSAGLLWVEHKHRIVIGTHAAAEVATPATVCPDKDSLPFSVDCIAYINGAASSYSRPQIKAAAGAPQETDDASMGPACPPSNETAPYSARCLRFISGWFFHPSAVAQSD